eukprot:360141-Chlamydomonas_euryale.AAC.3
MSGRLRSSVGGGSRASGGSTPRPGRCSHGLAPFSASLGSICWPATCMGVTTWEKACSRPLQPGLGSVSSIAHLRACASKHTERAAFLVGGMLVDCVCGLRVWTECVDYVWTKQHGWLAGWVVGSRSLSQQLCCGGRTVVFCAAVGVSVSVGGGGGGGGDVTSGHDGGSGGAQSCSAGQAVVALIAHAGARPLAPVAHARARPHAPVAHARAQPLAPVAPRAPITHISGVCVICMYKRLGYTLNPKPKTPKPVCRDCYTANMTATQSP